MILLRGFTDDAPYRGGYVAIGNFDGVHRGHQSMIEVLVRRAHAAGVAAVVLTFDPHPIELLRPHEAPPSLSTVEHKTELLGQFGVDYVIAYPTDRKLLQLSPTEFFDSIVIEQLDARGLVEGPNFFFGRGRAGNVETLRELCAAKNLTLDVVEPFVRDGVIISSSVIRDLVMQGDLAHAVELLGHPYRVQGTVVTGERRGAGIGFPTANLQHVKTLLPSEGVYAGMGYAEGKPYPAAINLGPNPTFGGAQQKLEVHLVGFQGNLYGQTLDVDFLDRLRDVTKFSGIAELQSQLARDVARAVQVAAKSQQRKSR